MINEAIKVKRLFSGGIRSPLYTAVATGLLMTDHFSLAMTQSYLFNSSRFFFQEDQNRIKKIAVRVVRHICDYYKLMITRTKKFCKGQNKQSQSSGCIKRKQ